MPLRLERGNEKVSGESQRIKMHTKLETQLETTAFERLCSRRKIAQSGRDFVLTFRVAWRFLRTRFQSSKFGKLRKSFSGKP
jgi:hypothetical protein